MKTKCHDCLVEIIETQIHMTSLLRQLLLMSDILAERINQRVEAAVLTSPLNELGDDENRH